MLPAPLVDGRLHTYCCDGHYTPLLSVTWVSFTSADGQEGVGAFVDPCLPALYLLTAVSHDLPFPGWRTSSLSLFGAGLSLAPRLTLPSLIFISVVTLPQITALESKAKRGKEKDAFACERTRAVRRTGCTCGTRCPLAVLPAACVSAGATGWSPTALDR